MNKILNKLPILAFALAATFAFGAQLPDLVSSNTPTKVWTPDESLPSGYREITNLVQGTHYNCVSLEEDCRVQFSNDNPLTGEMEVLQRGIYTPI